ncbi:M36 family metallopeptidase [Bradyrhizobium sp. 8-10B]|uniref:M36 family metallopeptidase n=1 Tax=Bradyrhizobium sp. 8-10B TaxID=3344579 RepID=UPI0035C24DA1
MASFDLEQLKIDRHLSGKPRRITGVMPLEPSAAATDAPAVTSFLNSHAGELQLGVDPAELKLVHEADTPVRKIYRYQKEIGGIPLHNGYVIVQVDNEANVNHIEVSQDAQKTPGLRAHDAADIGAGAAEQKALQSLGADVKLRGIKPDPEKMYFSTDAGLQLSYKVLIPTQEPMHDWQIFVDADTGEILSKQDIIKHLPDGAGMVFDPNPVVTANNNTLRQPTATIAGGCGYAGTALATIEDQRVSRTLKDLTLAGGVHTLDGPYARIINISAPTSTIPTEAIATNFNYSSSDERLGAVTTYYHIDTIQRYIQSLGITTANNRRTDADPAVSGFSAYYSPVDKSLHMGTSRPCHPDKSQEGDAIIHEYGHAIQDNQVPGWGVTNPITHRDETGAMGEGFGDTLACVFFASAGNGFQRETFEDWAYVENGAAGLRRVDGTKVYPTWAYEVHADGEIWSAALWNIYRAIGGDALALADRQAARDALLKSVVLSHHLLAVDASMPDGAEAVMRTNADLVPTFLGT